MGEFINLSQQVHNKNRTNEPTMQEFVYANHIEIKILNSQNRIIPFVSPSFGLQ